MLPTVCALSFFFQAEDGIRDYKVTGVQTCALPIFERPVEHLAPIRHPVPVRIAKVVNVRNREGDAPVLVRSEERRVGKEWRGRRTPGSEKERDRKDESAI